MNLYIDGTPMQYVWLAKKHLKGGMQLAYTPGKPTQTVQILVPSPSKQLPWLLADLLTGSTLTSPAS